LPPGQEVPQRHFIGCLSLAKRDSTNREGVAALELRIKS
jgi:hypothetical protein